MGNGNSNISMNPMQVNNNACMTSKSKHSSGSPIGSIGMNSRNSGSDHSKNQLPNGIKTLAVKHGNKNSPTFYGHDINYDNTVRQSGSSGGNRNANFIHHQIRGTINSKKVINFDDDKNTNNKDDQLENNNDHQRDVSTRKSNSNNILPKNTPALALRDREANSYSRSPGLKDRGNNNYFSHDIYGGKQDTEEFYSKKFAMMIPSNTTKNSQVPGQGQVGANKSNENPPTYKRGWS